MAGKVKKEDIDEKAIIASFASDEPTDHDALMRESREADETPPQAEPPKEDTRRRKVKEQDYESLFIRESVMTARKGNLVYIRTDFHDTLKALCSVLGDEGITISGYIDNVLAHHIETYGGEMNCLYNERHKGLNINKNIKK